ncbi:MAG: hypothetical protein IJD04_09110 [Desulfovibrionaceae bacterium]|nr:hypothetical protein [Desulfovibrionaceae bacterium]
MQTLLFSHRTIFLSKGRYLHGEFKKNLAIVLGSTQNYFFATGTVVLNLLRFSPRLADDIIIFYDAVSPRDREILEEECGCRFIQYSPPVVIPEGASSRLTFFTPLSLSIYEIFNLLDEYRNVLWLDSDVCILADISGILDIPGDVCIRFGGTCFKDALGCETDPEIDSRPTNNTGVVLVRDSLPGYQNLAEQCYAQTLHFHKTLYLPDQAVLNYVLWQNKITPVNLGREYNYTAHFPFQGIGEAKIFHTACAYKFWNHSVMRNLFPIWEECHKQWLAGGGSPYTGEMRFRETGSKLNILDIFVLLEQAEMQIDAHQMIIDEQRNAIENMKKYVGELLNIVRNK